MVPLPGPALTLHVMYRAPTGTPTSLPSTSLMLWPACAPCDAGVEKTRLEVVGRQ